MKTLLSDGTITDTFPGRGEAISLLALPCVWCDGVVVELPPIPPLFVEAIAQLRRCAPLARLAVDPSGHPDTVAFQASNGRDHGWTDGWLIYTNLQRMIDTFQELPDRAFWTHWRLVERLIGQRIAGPSREVPYLAPSKLGYRLISPGPGWFVLAEIPDDPSLPGPQWQDLRWDNEHWLRYWTNPNWSPARIELHDLWGIAHESATYTRETKRLWQLRDAELQAAESRGDDAEVERILAQARKA